MRKIQNYVFVLLMCFLTSITALRYHHIQKFKLQSQEHAFEVDADQSRMLSIKSELQNITHQLVTEEFLSEGRYRLIIRCPSDKIGAIQNFLRKQQ